MATILGVGIAVLDELFTLEGYPAEDSEQRALQRATRLGGNTANTLTVLTQLGHTTRYAGVLADEPQGRRIAAALEAVGIDTADAHWQADGQAPLSHIWLNRQSGTRTIVHHRDLAELGADAFAGGRWSESDWIHFEGRNVRELQRMIAGVQDHAGLRRRFSVEIEKEREGIDALWGDVPVLIVSRAFVRGRGWDDPEAFARHLRPSLRADACLVIPWGEAGAFAWSPATGHIHQPAVPPHRVLETVGAGDTFNAGLIHGLLGGDLVEALRGACTLAGRKCGQAGFAGLVG
jgi:ketohexokinase